MSVYLCVFKAAKKRSVNVAVVDLPRRLLPVLRHPLLPRRLLHQVHHTHRAEARVVLVVVVSVFF